MTGNIKGITIEFRGDTTKLDKALRSVRTSTKDIDGELKKVNNALKFNPTSVELWRQKQELLRQKISQTEANLKQLKNMQSQMDAKGVDKNSQEYRELQREIVTTESKLKTFKKQLVEIGNVKLKALSEQLKEVGGKMTSVGKTMTTKVTAPIVAGYTLASSYASDYEENLNKLDVAFGSNSQKVKDWANNARESFGLSKVQATEAASAFGALGKGVGLTESEAADMSTTLAGLSADLGSYFNVGTDESSKALEGIFTGESEALKKFGVVMTDTNLQKFAEDQGLVWKELDQTEKTMLRYQFVLDKTKDAQGDFARTNDGTANSTKIFKASIQDLGTSIGTNLLPIITPVIQKITEWINKFNDLSPRAQKIITIIGLIAAAIGPVIVIIGTLASSIGSIISLIGVVGPAIGGIVTTLGPVVLAIGAVIAIGILLYKNWDKIKAKALELKQKVALAFQNLKTSISTAWENIKTKAKTTWAAIKTAITTPITNAITAVKEKVSSLKTSLSEAWASIKEKVSTAWSTIKEKITGPFEKAKEKLSSIIETIKGWFPINLGNLFSGIKTPHFSLKKATAEVLGKTITYPVGFDVSWYKKGGIFDSPSLIGVGEAGAEAVVPLDKFWEKLDQMQMGQNIVININGAGDPRAVAEEVKRVLIRETNQRRLAWQ